MSKFYRISVKLAHREETSVEATATPARAMYLKSFIF